MSIGKIALLAVIGVGLGVFQYQRDLQAAHAENETATSTANHLRAQLRQEEHRIAALKVELGEAERSNADKSHSAAVPIPEEIAAQVEDLKRGKSALRQQFADTVKQVRSATVGMQWPVMHLPDDTTLQDVVVKEVTAKDVALAHTGGMTRLLPDALPFHLKQRLRYGFGDELRTKAPEGTSDLESDIRTLEQERSKLHQSKTAFMKQATEYRNKDALAVYAGTPRLYVRVIPKIAAAARKIELQISELSVEIANLQIRLADLRPLSPLETLKDGDPTQ